MPLNGPVVTQPPPVPRGNLRSSISIGGSSGSYSPSPESEESLPSNRGLAVRLDAHTGQSQYLFRQTWVKGQKYTRDLRLVALISAFVAKSLLPEPGKMPVPREKDSTEVDRQGIIDMSPRKSVALCEWTADIRNKIIHAIPNPGIMFCWESRRFLLQAKNGIGIVDSFARCHRSPLFIR